MRKTVLAIVCAASLAFAVPAEAINMVMDMGVAEQVDDQTPTLSIEGNTVSVQWASGMTLEVVSLTGRSIANYKIEGPAQRFELNLPKGCYILKVGKVVRKVTVH